DYLRWFDAQLDLHAGGAPKARLFTKLEHLRAASFGRWRLGTDDSKTGVDGEGDSYESISWPVAEDVPFDLAAGLQVGAIEHPGLMVRPALRRQCVEPPGTSLHALLGVVEDLGRLRSEVRNFESYAARELPSDWLEEIVPEDASLTADERSRIQDSARQRFESMAMRYERGGKTGVERAFDEELSGHLGMRLVERDSKQREQWLWSSLRVQIGQDVTLTIDGELQRLVERHVGEACDRMAAEHPEIENQSRVAAAMAVIDAWTGDVLAVAGAPLHGTAARQVPGVVWFGNGSLGSVVKPFVLVEQLSSEMLGRPHKPLAEIEPCSGPFEYGSMKLSACGRHLHWDEGKDPVAAIAKSCNRFFYQVAVGLGADGVERALQRFGLLPSAAGSEFAASWQDRVPGFPWYSPRLAYAASVPQRAIGYGVAATPLAVARAYAGIATGRLPTLGMVAGAARPVVDLDAVAAELELVRKGLRACVEWGTADDVIGLRNFAVEGKTGTAEIGDDNENNAWFAGYLPTASPAGVQLCFCSVIYWVRDGTHGATAAGGMVAQVLAELATRPDLCRRYLPLGSGR
ncbi:MAG: hypothetical protein KDC98_22985, partial [Planctomycetes bacterium]|nr:hypothetical protein [Planctomycetota bacterium]